MKDVTSLQTFFSYAEDGLQGFEVSAIDDVPGSVWALELQLKSKKQETS